MRKNLVQYDKDKEFESNSQQQSRQRENEDAWFSMTKIKNLKAIHNNMWCRNDGENLVQYDKDKEFESNSQPVLRHNVGLMSWFSMTKIKNLKAIHNDPAFPFNGEFLVQYDKDKEFESNSQQSRFARS